MAKKEVKNNKDKTSFTKSFKAELKKVIWPTPKQLVNNTVAVVTIVIITAIIVFALDAVFDLGNKYGISRLQSIVNEKYNNTDSTKNDTDSSNTESTDEIMTPEDTSSTEENTTENENSDETPSTENTDGESSNEE